MKNNVKYQHDGRHDGKAGEEEGHQAHDDPLLGL